MMGKSSLPVTLFICLIRYCLCQPVYFRCYKDLCIRGLRGSQDSQYCNDTQQRCSFCRDKLMDCGKNKMPRDCDGYCIGLKLRKVQDESLQQLNKSLAETSMELIQLRAERDELELILNTTNDNLRALQTNFSELDDKKTKVESDLKEGKEKQFVLTVTVWSLLGICVFLIVLKVCMYARQKRQGRGKKDSKVSEHEHENLMPKTSTEFDKASSVDSAVNLSRDQSRCTTPDASGVDCEKATENDKCFIFTREEPSAAFKNDDAKVQAEPTDVFAQGDCQIGKRNFDGEDLIGDSGSEDNCLRKDTPAALKGIQPTTTSASQTNLNQKMYS